MRLEERRVLELEVRGRQRRFTLAPELLEQIRSHAVGIEKPLELDVGQLAESSSV